MTYDRPTLKYQLFHFTILVILNNLSNLSKPKSPHLVNRLWQAKYCPSLKDIHIPIPKISDYDMLHGKEEWN